MKNVSVYLLAFVLAILLTGPISAQTQITPEQMLADANSKIRVAQDVMDRATKLVSDNPKKEELKTAMYLYIEAGKMFQEGGAILKYLGPKRVNKTDIEGCDKAVDSCLGAVRTIQAALRGRK